MEFLTFKSFISINVLIAFYYLGAFVLPIFLIFISRWIVIKFKILQDTTNFLWSKLNKKQKVKIIFVFTICFLFMELFWRMLFEFLIAYIQIRDALVN